MKREEAIYCLKAQSERYSEVCEECPLYGQTGVDHCCEDALQMAITALQNQPGDILYVRETWRVGAWDIFNQMIAFDYKDGTCGELTYIHDRELFDRLVNQSRNDARQAKCEYNGADFVWEKGKSPCRWHPSIHMPKEAARIWLKVTDVRVERLQEITEEQACVEGTDPWDEACYENNGWHPTFSDPDSGGDPNMIDGFHKLWNSTIKKSDLDRYGWDPNPWVWVIEFERCEKPEGV